ncbi:MAG: translation initiation factor IF-2 [Candidatus Aenigmarchaeota archaeon]|nr:translation initiation factor IF-2 [Candidatus Aenigmarchaeota archaeon]
MRKIRSPILVLLGHVDHGKTSLVDKVRGTAVAKGEPGAITQYISASYVPLDVIRSVCGHLLAQMKIELDLPGFLWIDSPGHEAFTTLRKRGGAIADLAILVVDINEGFKPQTDESLSYLKQFRTPFVIAATKIDRMLGWIPKQDECFLDSFPEQTSRAQDELEEKIYRLISQLAERGFAAERFDRVSDFAKQVAVVPVSSVTGEGIPDLLMTVGGIAQKYLKGRLEITTEEGKGTVLEVKEFKGLGMTIDVVLYDGEINKGDFLVIGGSALKEPVITRVKALLQPAPLKELRIEKNFQQLDSVIAAAGIKISAPGLENVIAGSPLRAVRSESEIGKARQEIAKEMEEVEIETDREGLVLKADTLGGLEALIKILREMGISIRKAKVGDLSKSDIMEIRSLKEPVVFCFNVKIPSDVQELANDNNVTIFSSNVIYTIIEEYEKWVQDRKKREEEAILHKAARPGRVRALPGYVFRQSRPAVFGVEVLKGIIKPGIRLKKGKDIVGGVKEMQMRGENIKEAKSGDKVAISMPDVTIGKEVKENDVLDVFLSYEDLDMLQKIRHKLSEEEKELLEEYGR